MTDKTSPDSKKKSQHDRFKELARETGAEDNSDAFEKAFGKIVPPKKPEKR